MILVPTMMHHSIKDYQKFCTKLVSLSLDSDGVLSKKKTKTQSLWDPSLSAPLLISVRLVARLLNTACSLKRRA